MPSPEQCQCWGAPIATVFPRWAARTKKRVAALLKSGKPAPPLEETQREATLVRALCERRKGPLDPRNRHRGHLCEECPFRLRSGQASSESTT